MDSSRDQPTSACHVVAMPYPGRGHINPMMNLCKQLVRRNPNIIVSFVVTEEWLGFIGSDPKPDNIRFATLPNVIPSELDRANDFLGFIEAVFTKLEEPFEQLLDRLDPPAPALIIADTYVVWAAGVGNRRNIPVASLWTMSATMLCFFLHSDLILQNRCEALELREDEVVDVIPGIPPTRLADFPPIFHGFSQKCFLKAQKCFQEIPKAQYLLFTTFYELEPKVIDVFKFKFNFPIYPVGPSIPYPEIITNSNGNLANSSENGVDSEYLQWLDLQPKNSVLYISFGSFLSVSKTQMDAIVAGIRDSGVRLLWVARGDASRVKESFGDDDDDVSIVNKRRSVVSWCEQLRVLCHPSVGGFWTHCGFNSTLEGIYSGVPMLTFPIFWDQISDSKQITDDWRVGLRVKGNNGMDLVKREEIRDLVKKFMDLETVKGTEMRDRMRELSKVCRKAVVKGGSSDSNIDAFIRDITKAL